MANTATRTKTQAVIARRIAIANRMGGQPRRAPRSNPTPAAVDPMLAACVAAAGFSEHRAR